MMAISRLVISPENPVDNVKRAIRPHEKDVISSQILYLAITLKHNQLRKNRHCLEVYAESPQQLLQIQETEEPPTADQVGQGRHHSTRSHGKFPMAECILCLVVCWADGLLEADGVDDARCGGDVEDFHYWVVEAVVRRKEIGVAREEDEKEELVGAQGDSLGIFGDAETEEENDDREDVGHVSAEAEDIHAHGWMIGVFSN